MIFPSIQNLHPKIIIQKQPETRGIPPLPAAVLFLLDFILSGLNPALLRPYYGPYAILISGYYS